MDIKNKKYLRVSGISFIAAGMLFLVQNMFLLFPQFPPDESIEIQKWLFHWKFNISMSNEILFFGSISLIPSIIGLYKVLIQNDKVRTSIGCGILALVITILSMICMIQGRLVYPVFDMELSPDVLKLLLSIYYGGYHMVYLLFSIAVIILGFAMKRSGFGKSSILLGIMTGLIAIIGAFPWLIGPYFTFMTQIIFSFWFVYVGLKIIILTSDTN